MIIAVKNHSRVPDGEVLAAVRAVNRQIAEDFSPYWDLSGTLRVADRSVAAVEADGIIRIWDTGHNFHLNPAGIPTGHVFTDVSKVAQEAVPWLSWHSGLSHEALEMIADPFLNTLARGPHPASHRQVFHYLEICDPVQSETYLIDGIAVSNFVLPHYYNPLGQKHGRNDFLGTGLEAFRWNENGEIGFWDPRLGARGGYVSWPQYPATHVVSRHRRAKGRTARLHRYAHPPVAQSKPRKRGRRGRS
jgi:hypothetical protein